MGGKRAVRCKLIASLVEPVTYDRLAVLKVILLAGGLILGLFLVLALACILSGLRHRQDRPSRRAWGKK